MNAQPLDELADVPLTVTLPLNTWIAVLAHLDWGIHQNVAHIIRDIQRQAIPQIEAAQQAAQRAAQQAARPQTPADEKTATAGSVTEGRVH